MLLKDRIRQILNLRKPAFFVRDKGEWVTVFIELDKKGNGFTFSMVGSYVNGGHYWGGLGNDWRKFLKNIYADYFGMKILAGGYRVFDPEASIRAIKEKVIQWRRDGYMDRDQARELWDEAEYREDDLQHEAQVFEWFSKYCVDPYDATEFVRSVPHRQFTEFYNRLWPKFLAQL